MKHRPRHIHKKNIHGVVRGAVCLRADLPPEQGCVWRPVRSGQRVASAADHARRDERRKPRPWLMARERRKNIGGLPESALGVIATGKAGTTFDFADHRRVPQPLVLHYPPERRHFLFQFFDFFFHPRFHGCCKHPSICLFSQQWHFQI